MADDKDETRKATHQHLHALGYTFVDYVPDARTALVLLKRRTYSLVLSDWETPRVDGAQILRAARGDKRTRALPFLMVIPAWQRKFIEIVRQDGATLYLTRPFTREVLGERMQQVDKDAAALQTLLRADAQPSGRGPSELWTSLRPDALATVR